MSPSSAPDSVPPDSSHRELVGVVLAGGASRRLGRDKARLEIDGEPLVARAARKLATVCSRVLVADGGRQLLSGDESPGAWPSVADGPGAGPAAGILGAARVWPGDPLLVLACDLPLVPVELLEALAYTPPDVDWALPYSRREDGLHPEPLCARYGSKTLEALAARVAREELALHPLAEDSRLHIRRIEPDELSSWGQPERLLLNVNRPQDFEVLEEFLRSG